MILFPRQMNTRPYRWEKEVWRRVATWSPHRYMGSNFGRILGPSGRILKGDIRAYKCVVTIHLGQGRNKKRSIGPLILEAFSGPRPPGEECRHLDGDPTNNYIGNLRWGTSKENSDDSKRHGTAIKGSRVGTSSLTESQVMDILRSDKSGYRLSYEYHVSEGTISMIRNGHIWKHVFEEFQNANFLKRERE